MPEFEMPISVQRGDRRVDLVARAPLGARWADVVPQLCRAAEVPVGSRLLLGSLCPGGDAEFGRPPLLAGIVLTVTPDNPTDRQPIFEQEAGLEPEAGPESDAGTEPEGGATPNALVVLDPILGPAGAGDPATAGILVLDCVAGPDAGGSVAVHRDPLLIGRSPTAELTIADPELSARHAVVHARPGGVSISDLLSTNGTRVGTESCDPQHLLPLGVPASLGASAVRLDLPAVVPMLRHPDGAGHWVLSVPARAASSFTHPVPDDPGSAPERTRRRLPLVASLAGAVAGSGIALLTGMRMFLLMAALGPVTMLATAIGDRVSGRRSHRRAAAEHAAATVAYAAALATAAAADRADSWERFSDPARLLRWARAGGVRLWDRPSPGSSRPPPDRPGGPPPPIDLVLSVGGRPARLDCADPPRLTDVPLSTELPACGVVGLCGRNRGTLRWLLAQLIGRYSPADLALRVLSGSADLASLRDSPHSAEGGCPGRVHSRPGELLAALRRSTTELTVAVVDDIERWRDDAAGRELLRAHDDRLLVLAIGRSSTGLPVACDLVIDLDRLPGDPIGVGPRYLDQLVKALVPFAVAADGAAALPRRVCAAGTDRQQLAASWLPAAGPRVELGIGIGGPVTLDLAADGPHLLIAGTTGSGKSELLQTLIAGLASALAPPQLAFLLIDYKGGAAFADAARLPHAAGLVTDLDPPLAARALASLRAEIRSREKTLAAAGVGDLTALTTAVAPPRLVIMVDEFAALAAELPDFLSGLVDIAQRGRSLGLHLVLATQRPTGVVSPAILANTSARICLRVTDPADATAIMDSTAPAAIPADLPGRGYLRLAGGRPAPFQTRLVTAGAAGGIQAWQRDTVPEHDDGPAPMATLIDAAAELARRLPRTPSPWLPPLPERLECADPAVLGSLDLPEQQRQPRWPMPTGSLLVCGPPGSGRTGAARRWAGAMAAAGGHLLVVDTGGSLADLAAHPAVASYLGPSEPQLVLRLFTVLDAELTSRAGRRGPTLGVLIDGWEPLCATLDTLDYGQWQSRLTEIAGRGPAAGIRVAVTGGPRLAQHRVAQGFGETLLLAARSATGEPVAGLPPGRGWLAGKTGAEVQLAQAGPLPRPAVSPITTAGAGAGTGAGTGTRAGTGAGAGNGTPPWVIRPLPSTVGVRSLPAAAPDAVPIGVGGDAAGALCLDLTGPGGGLLIAGRRRSGVSTALQVFAAAAAAAGLAVVRPTLRAASPLPAVRDIDLKAGSDPLLRLLADHEGPLVLAVDDADRIVEHPASELLIRFLEVAGAGQYLALGTRLDHAARSRRGLIAEVAAFRSGVLLGADAIDAAVLDTNLPRRRLPAAPGRGHLVHNGAATEIQIALPDQEYS